VGVRKPPSTSSLVALFSKDCWNSPNIHRNFNLQPLDMLIEARKNFGNLVFREIIITACWIGLSRRLEIVLSLIMVPAIVYGKDNSWTSLDWCTKAKPTRKGPLTLWRKSYS
jgi:hypothetical protein